ncbi:MAG: tetratricopeptide repeat protein [bacterium]
MSISITKYRLTKTFIMAALLCGFTGLPNLLFALSEDPKEQFGIASTSFRSGNYDKALKEYELFCKHFSKDKKRPDAEYMLAECYFAQEKYSFAGKGYRDFLLRNAGRKDLVISARFRLGECELKLNKYLAAIDHFDWVRNQQNASLRPEAFYGIAQAQFSMGEYEKSQDTFMLLLQNYPKYQALSKIVLPFGLIYLKNGETKKALEIFARCPQDIACAYYKGVCHRLLNQVISASQLFKEVLEADPSGHFADKATYQMGEAYFQSKEFPLAYSAFKNVYDKHLDSSLRPYALFRMGCVNFLTGRFQEAGLKWDQLVKQYPHNISHPASIYLLSEIALRQNELGTAIGNYAKVQNVSAYAMDAAYKIVWCLAVQGQFEEAINRADSFIKEYQWGDLAAKTYLLKGLSYHSLKKYEEAGVEYQKVLDRFPESIYFEKALYLFALSYYQQEFYGELVTNIYQTLKMSPTSGSEWYARTYFWVAEGYYKLEEYESARMVYENILNNYKQSELYPNALQGVAACYAEEGDFDRAQDYQMRAMEKSQEMAKGEVSKSLVLDTADVLFNNREYEKAVGYYDEFITKYPDHHQVDKALFQQGIALYRLEYFSEAIKKWDKLATAHPSSSLAAESLMKVGKTYFGLGRYADAIKYYQKVIDKYPDDSIVRNAYLQINQCYYNQGRIKEAIAGYKYYIDTYPKDEKIDEVKELLQMSFYRLGKTPKELLRMTEAFPKSKFTSDIFWELGAEAFNQKKYDKALEYFEKIILDFPESSQAQQAFYYKAESYFMSGEYEAAMNNYKNFIQNYPDDKLVGQSRFKYAVSMFNLKDYIQAAVAFNEFIENNPSDGQVRDATLNIPLCYRKANQFHQSIESYKTFLRRYPDDPKQQFIYLQIGGLNEEIENYLQAIEAYKKIEPPAPETFEAVFSIARCYTKMKADEEAIRTYERLASFSPKNNQFRLAGLLILGEIYEVRGQINDSLRIFKDISSNSTNPEWSSLAREKIKILQGGSK